MKCSANIRIHSYTRRDGKAQLYLQVILDREKKLLYLDQFWYPELFDDTQQVCRLPRRTKAEPAAQRQLLEGEVNDINLVCANARAKATGIFTEARLRGQEIRCWSLKRPGSTTEQKSNQCLQSIGDLLKIKSRLHHVAREFFATEYMANGGGLKLLQHYLDHEDITTTIEYVRLDRNRIQAGIAPMRNVYERRLGVVLLPDPVVDKNEQGPSARGASC